MNEATTANRHPSLCAAARRALQQPFRFAALRNIAS
jgi:hypothetical protein